MCIWSIRSLVFRRKYWGTWQEATSLSKSIKEFSCKSRDVLCCPNQSIHEQSILQILRPVNSFLAKPQSFLEFQQPEQDFTCRSASSGTVSENRSTPSTPLRVYGVVWPARLSWGWGISTNLHEKWCCCAMTLDSHYEIEYQGRVKGDFSVSAIAAGFSTLDLLAKLSLRRRQW